MRKHIFLAVLFSFAAFQTVPPVFAQDEQPATPPVKEAEATTAEEPKSSASQEVEINEDTYRQFMELKDANQQRDIIPEETFKPGSGLQKLEKLPEESQKHLRNELREIIVGGDPWQPGDEDADYPYVPSNAARTDPSLQKQELEAWGELVDSYNQREAQIYANKAGNRATTSPEDGAGEMPGQGSMQNGESGQDKEGAQGSQNSATSESGQTETAGAYSPGATNNPNAQSTSGVSQNAMEFLQGLGNASGQAGGESVETRAGNSGPAGAPATSGEQGQGQVQSGRQANAGQPGDASGASPQEPADPSASEAGATQNALEFLQASSVQSGSGGATGTAASAANGAQTGGSAGSSDNTGGEAQQAGQNEGQESVQTGAQAGGQAKSEAGSQAGAQQEGQSDNKASAQNESEQDGKSAGQSSDGAEGQVQDGQQGETARSASSSPPADKSPAPAIETEEESTAGTSQNALEYLQGATPRTGEVGREEAGAETPPEGTLNIQDLLNAQGLDGAAPQPPAPVPEKKNPDDGTQVDKDGGS